MIQVQPVFLGISPHPRLKLSCLAGERDIVIWNQETCANQTPPCRKNKNVIPAESVRQVSIQIPKFALVWSVEFTSSENLEWIIPLLIISDQLLTPRPSFLSASVIWPGAAHALGN